MYNTIAVDIDDVLRDLMGHSVEIYNRNFPTWPMHHDRIVSWDMTKYFPIGEKILDFLFVGNVKELYTDSPVIEGALEGMAYLRRHCKNLILLSDQPTMRRKALTLEWVSQRFIDIDGVFFTPFKHSFDFDYLIDDKPETLTRVGPERAIKFKRPWNIGHSWEGRIMHSWADIANVLGE